MADIDANKIKEALDKFDSEEMTDAKEILIDEISKAVKSYIKKELGLEDDEQADIKNDAQQQTDTETFEKKPTGEELNLDQTA